MCFTKEFTDIDTNEQSDKLTYEEGLIQNYCPCALYACTAPPLDQTQKHMCKVVQDLSTEHRMRSVH